MEGKLVDLFVYWAPWESIKHKKLVLKQQLVEKLIHTWAN
jgi:hypothetical protein